MSEKAEILFVCIVNTGLAWMAEGAMRARLARAGLADQYRLLSAVLSADLRPTAAAGGENELAHGFDLRGQPLTEERVNQADLILVMSAAEQQAILEHFVGAEGKTFLLSEMAGPAHDIARVKAPSRQTLQRLSQDVAALVEAGFETILSRAEAARAATMANVGLSHGIFDFEFFPSSVVEILTLFQRAGIRFVDWHQDCSDDIVYTPAEQEQYAALLEAHNLRCKQLHGFDSRKVHAVTKGEALERYVAVQGSRVELCARLGGDSVVIHIPGLYWRHLGISLQEAMEHTTIALDRLRPLCEKLGVRLAVENSGRTRDPDGGPMGHNKERLDFYLSRYPAEFTTFCLDLGHANLAGDLEALKAYGSRLSALHLHDNKQGDDDHQPPFFGTVDWAGLLGWLQEIDYQGSINFELYYRRSFFPGSPPEFVAYATQRIRQALSLQPALR